MKISYGHWQILYDLKRDIRHVFHLLLKVPNILACDSAEISRTYKVIETHGKYTIIVHHKVTFPMICFPLN